MALSHAFLTKLLAFCTAVEVQSNQKNYANYPDLHEKVRPSLERVNKYVRVYFDTGSQKLSRYFVRVSDGAIFACKSWKAPNLNRQFGTLDTIDEFDWSGYEGVARPDSQYTMVGTYGPYQTAVLK